MFSVKLLTICLFTVGFVEVYCRGISCKDENNKDVDWYVVYKLPKIDTEPKGSLLYEGKGYAYLTSSRPTQWTLSERSVESPKSMFGRTWSEYEKKTKSGDSAYLFYNDDPPETVKGTAVGHLKGSLAFDVTSGFWLIHSVPRFGDKDKYEYPRTALINGQSALCVTFGTSYLDDICNHLIFCNPFIYYKNISSSILALLGSSAKSLFSEKPAFIRKPPFLYKSVLESCGGETFYSYAKDNQMQVDIYSDILASNLSSSLIAETWRRGVGTFLHPSCNTSYTVTDVKSVSVPVANREQDISFKSTEDHSKWAISLDYRKSPWVCVGDINRMKSQARRGGGALCFKSKPVWSAYRSTVVDTSVCQN
ncbi:hypothetical protein JTE90_016302 [Oedothorax gibbosus]|uniref:Uncharacterized protein n=1 Tax=Oedothorax gibbosus TaxID=931172 RepID=A0AAV6U728_9ARAC|nr:hypothetical protein JTE90_016302 [Oedothorax gibbosus]